jgi:hypothetical protein
VSKKTRSRPRRVGRGNRNEAAAAIEAQFDWLHHCYKQTKNPLYTWEAIVRYLNANEPIPDWCIPYLRRVATNLTNLAWATAQGRESNDRAVRQVPNALLFSTGQGKKNAFASLADERILMIDAPKSIKNIKEQRGFKDNWAYKQRARGRRLRPFWA